MSDSPWTERMGRALWPVDWDELGQEDRDWITTSLDPVVAALVAEAERRGAEKGLQDFARWLYEQPGVPQHVRVEVNARVREHREIEVSR